MPPTVSSTTIPGVAAMFPRGDWSMTTQMGGSEMAGTRGENIREKLVQLSLSEERVRVEQIAISDFQKLPRIIDEFVEHIEHIGMNPFKGMPTFGRGGGI